MTTLLVVYNSDGCVGRCDAKCYNATCEDCTCVCGGVNHGVGVNQAIENTKELAEEWLKEYGIVHPYDKVEVLPKPVQMEMFGHGD